MSEKMEKRSFETVNYLLRPKKQIERKIIIEILQELGEEIVLSQYRYVGFGSIYYYDFILFHKYLQLNDLVSLDDKPLRKRFVFNLPYDYVSFENKKSTDYLREFDWKKKVLIWLDYDEQINDGMLADLEIIADNCKYKDILIITIDATCPEDPKTRDEYQNEFYENYGKYLSPEFLDKEALGRNFTPAMLANLLQDLILNYLKDKCVYRYVDMEFYKLFSFTYKDTAPMFTMGGIFLEPTDELRNKGWNAPFICRDRKITDIDVPLITYREKLHIDSVIKRLSKTVAKIECDMEKLDSKTKSQIVERRMEELPFELTFGELRKYVKFYKYYPQYYEGII